MAKLIPYTDSEGKFKGYQFECPGCGHLHAIPIKTQETEKHPIWQFNNDLEKPTFNPSVKCTIPRKDVTDICHFFVRNGMIQYCSDSTHHLSGKIVSLPDIG